MHIRQGQSSSWLLNVYKVGPKKSNSNDDCNCILFIHAQQPQNLAKLFEFLLRFDKKIPQYWFSKSVSLFSCHRNFCGTRDQWIVDQNHRGGVREGKIEELALELFKLNMC